MTKTTLAKEQRAEIRTTLKDAIFHLCSCWDSLREAEEVFQEAGLEIEVESEDIEFMTIGCCPADDAYHISDEDLDSLIDEKLCPPNA